MKIVFMGTPGFAANVLQKLINENYDVALVVSQPDRPVGRKKELFPTPVKKVAMDADILVFQPEKVNDNHHAILDANPDIIITAAYGQIIPKEVLDAPGLGCINVHASLLPKYRGGAPIHQAIIDGELETGVTIMYMEETMDTGDIISWKAIPILETDDAGSMFEKLSIVGADLLVDTLPLLENETAQRIPQDEAKVTYAWNIKREQELVNWNKPARTVYNHIRGLHPWPVAYTTLGDVNIKIFKSELVNQQMDHEAGTIVAASADGVDVVCGDGQVLRLLDIQLAGKKRIAIKDLLNGIHPFEIKEKFKFK